MNNSTAINHKYRYIAAIDDIFSQARSFKLSHKEILDTFQRRIYGASSWQILPRHVKQYIYGYMDAMHKAHNNELVWYVYWRGALTHPDNVLPGTWDDCESNKGRHVYKSNPTKVF